MTDTATRPRRRVLSGMRPTGRLHLGNYMGALYNWVRLQDDYECYFFIADWHALTTDYADPSKIHQNTMEVALDFLSAGLDPTKSTIFVQSHVPQHAELHLLFSMFTPLSWLERVPTYKDQIEQLRAKDLNTYGFLGYPLLQSADILLYRPEYVPVGQDQVSHVELTREVARRFNQLYGAEGFRGLQSFNEDPDSTILPEPDVLLTPTPKLPGTDGRKMSKSYNNFISMTDEPAVILHKIAKMTNGGQRFVQTDPGNPDVCPVGDLHAIFSRPDIDATIRTGCRTAGISCEGCKLMCAQEIVTTLRPIQERRSHFEANPHEVIRILQEGAERATATATETMHSLRIAVGLGRNLADVRIDHPLKQKLRAAAPVWDYDLSAHSAWWDIEEPEIRSRELREWWLAKALPTDVQLKQDSPRVYVTSNRKRTIVTTSREMPDDLWQFEVAPKSYEVLTLLCWGKDFKLRDFIVPQKLYLEPWTAAKRADKKSNIHFQVRRDGDHFFLVMPAADPVDITRYQSSYDLLA